VSQAAYYRHLEKTLCGRISRQFRTALRQPRQWLKRLLRLKRDSNSRWCSRYSKLNSLRGDRVERRRSQNQVHHRGRPLFLEDWKGKPHHLDLHHSAHCHLLQTRLLSSCAAEMEAEQVRVRSQAHLPTRHSAIPG
jgi:hypothetical protein